MAARASLASMEKPACVDRSDFSLMRTAHSRRIPGNDLSNAAKIEFRRTLWPTSAIIAISI
jgi:hypothetical protein